MLSALPYVVVVPLAITGSQSLLAGHLRPRSNFGGWATFATTLANVGLMVAGHGLGVSPLNTSSVVGFTALSALVLPAISVAVMYAASPGWKAPSQRPPSVRMTVGGIPHQDTMGTWHLPLLSGTF